MSDASGPDAEVRQLLSRRKSNAVELLEFAIGTGLRFQEGRTFVVRADLAWSPDARPIGGYFAAGQIF